MQAKYLDSTIMGMGRGAGNAQTEFLYDFFNGKNEYSEKLFTSLIYKHFYNLKKNICGVLITSIIYRQRKIFILLTFKN